MRFLQLRHLKNPALGLADRARDRRRWDVAARRYRNAIEREPANFKIWVQYGHALKESNNLVGGELAYRHALELAPDVADTHLQLGHTLKLQGRFDEAAAEYAKALAIDPALHFASFELFNLGWGFGRIDDATLAKLRKTLQRKHPAIPKPAGITDSVSSVVFDVTDLMHYFMGSRLPTGIQRVQIAVLSSLLRKGDRKVCVTVACFSSSDDCWTAVPADMFMNIVDLALAGGDRAAPAWRAALSELCTTLALGEPLQLRRGAVLINLGTSWWIRDYLLMVKCAKDRYGIRYIPFVHDCIPIFASQYCAKERTEEFVSWIVDVFHQADGFLVNSQATATDLKKAARLLGHPEPEPDIIRLDACSHVAGSTAGQAVKKYGLGRSGFALFVSTIESRKNHLLVFAAWQSLIARRGVGKTPTLICVGKIGWRSEAALRQLSSDPSLKRKVLMLSEVGDDELSLLYSQCLFTVYPSSYEGWGLPVTESLCHGKVPLITRTSSLPEAGGDLAEYIDHTSPQELVAKLERLIDDSGYRSAREVMISRHFRPRSWAEIADEIVSCAMRSGTGVAESAQNKGLAPPPIAVGRYFPFSRSRETTLWPGMVIGETYRMGNGWWAPGDWGTWLKRDKAEIAFSLPPGIAGRHIVYVGLRGTPESSADFEVAIIGEAACQRGSLAAGEDRWVMLSFDVEAFRKEPVHVGLSTTGSCELGGANSQSCVVKLGVLGFYVCSESDRSSRRRFLDAVRENCLASLIGRSPECPGERAGLGNNGAR